MVTVTMEQSVISQFRRKTQTQNCSCCDHKT